MASLPWIDQRHSHGGRSLDTGFRESGEACPNCNWPIEPGTVASELAPPASASWTCEHCGWTMTASYHGTDDHSPRPGKP